MATYYVRVDGSNSNAGTADTSGGAWLTLAHAAANVAAGDTVYVRGSAGNASSFPTSSLDYTVSAYFTPTAGSAGSGLIKWIGLGTTPTINAPGLCFYAASYHWFEDLYFVATSNTAGSYGVLNVTEGVIRNCIINLNNQSAQVGIGSAGGSISKVTIYGGTSSPTSSSGAHGIDVTGTQISIHGCRIYKCRDSGIKGLGFDVRDCLIYGNVGDGILCNASDTYNACTIVNNTIHGNSGHGINVNGTNGAYWTYIKNNNITSQTGGSKAGIYCATSSSDIRKRDWGYNNVWNNTANYTNCTADSTDFSVNPSYTDAANGDFTPSEATLDGAAFPVSW